MRAAPGGRREDWGSDSVEHVVVRAHRVVIHEKLTGVGFIVEVIGEAAHHLNCTPKVGQKTFGVQFVYEKDIHREAQYSNPSTLWSTPETIVRTVPSWAALLRKSDRPLSQIRRRRTVSQGAKEDFVRL